MKIKSRLLAGINVLGILFLLISFGCSDNKEDMNSGSEVYSYELALKLVNNSGENILQHIECEAGTRVAFPEDYTYIRLFENDKSITVEELPVTVISDGKQNYLRPWTDAYPSYGFYSPIIGELSCPYIFGNNKFHEIMSEWQKGEKNRAECTKLTVDGKDYAVTYDATLGSYVATVVVNGGE